MNLIINCGEFEFTNFNRAIRELEYKYGYEGEAWDMVVTSNDLEVLCDFLNEDGLLAELEF